MNRRPINVALTAAVIGILVAVTIDLISWGPRKSTVAAPAVPVLPERTSTVPPTTVVVQTEFVPAGPAKAKRCELTRLMLLGDGFVSRPDGLRGPLYRSLYKSKMPINFVGTEKLSPTGGGDPSHEGHDNYTLAPDGSGKTTNLSDNLRVWLTSAETFPDIIMITAGATDIVRGGQVAANAPGNLAVLVTKVLDTMTEVTVIVAELPQTAQNAGLNSAAKAIGDASPTDRVVFASTSATLTDQKFDLAADLDADKLGLTISGGRKYARALDNHVIDAIAIHRAKKNCLSSSKTNGVAAPSTSTEASDQSDQSFVQEEDFVS